MRRVISYLSISKKEWNGTVVLLILIMLALIAPYVYQNLHKDKLINFKDFDKAVALLKAANTKKASASSSTPKTTTFTYTANKLKPGETVDINKADSAAFTRVHGIGPSFARRIVAYRQKLGGFVNKEQLKGVYGLDAEKYRDIADEVRIDNYSIKRLSINTITFDELRRFPYLSYKQANAIIQYREQHGNYHSLNDMRDIALLNNELLRKIAPYIIFK